MSWSQTDLDALRAAYVSVATGAAKVRYADGREVTFQSPDQVAAAITVVSTALTLVDRAAAGAVRRHYGAFRSGL